MAVVGQEVAEGAEDGEAVSGLAPGFGRCPKFAFLRVSVNSLCLCGEVSRRHFTTDAQR
jgi:hypothetical protein